MGCTSSAPNMADVQTNATDDVQVRVSSDTDETTEKNNHNNDVKPESPNTIEALPSCDNFTENIQLASKNKSTEMLTDAETIVTDIEENVPVVSGVPENETEENNIIKDEKITTFKEIADIVVVNKILEEEIKELRKDDLDKTNETIIETEALHTESCIPEITTSRPEELEINMEEDIEITEHDSPTQSECSRSTRWEALADLAAQLPPSLAVDPVTGQIYSLTK